MAINNIPSNLANLVAPFLPAGQRPVGQESADNRNSTFKPVEQLAESTRPQVQLNDADEEPQDQQRREGERETPNDAEELADSKGKKAPVDDPVELYSNRETRPRGPRGCLFDETV